MVSKQALLAKRNLRRKILIHLKKTGYNLKHNTFSKGTISKQRIRRLHQLQRKEKLAREKEFVEKHYQELSKFYANGTEINPQKIEPYIVDVNENETYQNLFRLTTLYWSVPVSQGFGRRIRCVVLDKQNNKLIGIFALGDPVFNLRVRDQWVGWNAQDRRERLVSVMDAYVLGAIPPYSNLLGGKLVASLLLSDKVQLLFDKKYGRSTSIIRHRKIRPKLALITTTSALGKSSVYDRIKLNGDLLFENVGNTVGYGHFHIPKDLFDDMKAYLEIIKHPYAHMNRFGEGPNWKMRVIRQALSEVGLSDSWLHHGIKREVYMVPLASNTKEYLLGKHHHLKRKDYKLADVITKCKERWIVPRSERDKSYLEIKATDTIKKMMNI